MPLFILLYLVLLVLIVFTYFDLVNLNYVGRMKILRPYGLKKAIKDAQTHPTWTNRGQNHDPGRFKRSNRSNKGGPSDQRVPRPDHGGGHGPWWSPRLGHGEPPSRNCLVFFTIVRLLDGF